MGLFDGTQYKYWGNTQTSSNGKPGGSGPNSDPSYGPGHTNLSYGVLWALTLIGGYFALDHLYLRSPLSFVAKILINVAFFGIWYIYDILQITFNKDVVKLFGLSIPGYGPAGIGAGVLGADKPDKNHTAFFVYALGLIFGGLFGLDSFITGHKKTGFIRIILLFSFIFTPVAIIWYLMNILKLFFNTNSVIEENSEYFGFPKPAEIKESMISRFLDKIPIISSIANFVKDPIEPIRSAVAAVEAPIKNIVEDAALPLKMAVQEGAQPIANAITGVTSVITTGEGIAKEGIKLADNTVKTIAGVEGVIREGEEDLKGVLGASTSLIGAYGQGVNEDPTNQRQTGGGLIEDSGVLPYVFMATLATIIVSGLVITYRRFRQNVSTKTKDDAPPNPAAIRGSDSKESSTTA
jgi:TM2 domain-containing membrane protein YozV